MIKMATPNIQWYSVKHFKLFFLWNKGDRDRGSREPPPGKSQVKIGFIGKTGTNLPREGIGSPGKYVDDLKQTTNNKQQIKEIP